MVKFTFTIQASHSGNFHEAPLLTQHCSSPRHALLCSLEQTPFYWDEPSPRHTYIC